MATHYRTLSYSVFSLFLALVVGYLFARHDYDVQGGLLVSFVLFPLSFLLIRHMAKAEGPQWFLTLLVIALALKLGVAMFRKSFYIAEYGGLYDAGRYHKAGVEIAQHLWRGDLASVLSHRPFGTEFTELYSGLVHTVTGPTVSGAYLVFGLLAFLGSYFFYRAFCIVFPHGHRRLYAVAVFLLPSLLYWPNGIGKDALMSLFIGLTAYGAARVFAGGYVKGILPLSAGLLGAMTVRPHMAAFLALALAAAFVLGTWRSAIRTPIVYLLGTGLVVGSVWFLLPIGMKFTGLQEVSPEGIEDYVELRQRQTVGGGSAFTPPSITDPASIPMVVATVLLRPFPWEAHNLQAFIQATDGLLLLALILWRIRSLGQTVRAIPSTPYLLFILVYTIIFFIAFIAISNFGTLARERAMLLPLFLMLIAFRPAPRENSTGYLETR